MKVTVHLTGDDILLKVGNKHRVIQRCCICGLLIKDEIYNKEVIKAGTWVKNVGKGRFVVLGRPSVNFLSFSKKELPLNCCINKVS